MRNINLDQLLGKPTTISEKFHHQTKLKTFPEINLPKKLIPLSWKQVYFKSYARYPEVKLPPPILLKGKSLLESLKKRESSRKYLPKLLPIKDISTILYYSAGAKSQEIPESKRFYPSAGARYPLEVYLIAQNCQLPKQLYHYYVRHHSLEQMPLLKKFSPLDYFDQSWLKKAGCLILISAYFKRTTIKYGDRGYRAILIEAGHLAQNIYLLSSGLKIGCCAVSDFLDEPLNELLGLDGLKESLLYVLALGSI